jgi:Ca2+-binding EF-hand superfamily protein
LTLNLGLTYDEIDDLMNMVDSDKSGSITYDEFISKMDIHIQKRTKVATKEVKLALYHKLKSLMDGNKESLYEIMMDYEYDNSGKIKTSDLLRVFKRIGILHPEPHMKTLIKAGGA